MKSLDFELIEIRKRKSVESQKLNFFFVSNVQFFVNHRHFVLAEEQSSSGVSKEDLTPNIPNFAPYLIIGGGTTAMSAFKSIRAHDPTAKVRF